MEGAKVIFISGKYRATSEWELEQHLRKAEDAAIKLWREGWIVYCPHKNTAHFGGVCDDSVWLDGNLEMLKRCDAIFMLDNWKESAGAIAEYNLARQLGIDILSNNWSLRLSESLD